MIKITYLLYSIESIISLGAPSPQIMRTIESRYRLRLSDDKEDLFANVAALHKIYLGEVSNIPDISNEKRLTRQHANGVRKLAAAELRIRNLLSRLGI